MDKRSSTWRLTDEARRLIVLLAMMKGVSQSSVIELAVRDMAKRERVLDQSKEKS